VKLDTRQAQDSDYKADVMVRWCCFLGWEEAAWFCSGSLPVMPRL